jgi:hypothetical protein
VDSAGSGFMKTIILGFALILVLAMLGALLATMV